MRIKRRCVRCISVFTELRFAWRPWRADIESLIVVISIAVWGYMELYDITWCWLEMILLQVFHYFYVSHSWYSAAMKVISARVNDRKWHLPFSPRYFPQLWSWPKEWDHEHKRLKCVSLGGWLVPPLGIKWEVQLSMRNSELSCCSFVLKGASWGGSVVW